MAALASSVELTLIVLMNQRRHLDSDVSVFLIIKAMQQLDAPVSISGVWTYVCMYVCMYVCVYVCIYVCMHVCICMYVFHVCMYVCHYLCMSV